jgi:hypothetical protein
MVRSATPKGIHGMMVLALGVGYGSGVEAKTDADLDQHIRRIVDGMMQEKDAEIAGLKARVQDLESQLRRMPKPAGVQESRAGAPTPAQAPPPETPPAPAGTPEAPTAQPASDDACELRKIKREVKKLTEAEEARLKFNGFFDMSAKTRNPEGKTFDFGSIELDTEAMHKTYLLRRTNEHGELCLVCHAAEKD